ncbi:MAG: hypothetical protein KDI46_08435 [Alphaproteobacteria bacterium]|nr:hypothetical protein [Alphaproteobacteria bacterium]
MLEIRDNGGLTYDRYTVVYDEIGDSKGNHLALAMSSNPFDPLGFGQHCTAQPGKHLGQLINFEDLPPDCQKAVNSDLSS